MTHSISVLLDKAHVNDQQHQSTGGFAPFPGGLWRVRTLLGPTRDLASRSNGLILMEAGVGIEPAYTALQAAGKRYNSWGYACSPPGVHLDVQMRHGRGSAATRFVCGYLGCNRSVIRPLISALPRLALYSNR